MAKKTTLRSSIKTIEEALRAFVKDDSPLHVFVFESSRPYLRALIVNDHFVDMQVSTRQNEIWDHLKKELTPDLLDILWGVHPYTWQEYDEEYEQSSSSADPSES